MTNELHGAVVKSTTVNVGVGDTGLPAVELILGYGNVNYAFTLGDEGALNNLIFQLVEARKEITA